MKLIGPPPRRFLTGKELGVVNFSPDGRKLVLAVKEKKTSRLYLINTDGTGTRDISGDTTFLFDPSFSPDGKKILYCESRNGRSSLCRMAPDGSGKTSLTGGPEHDYDPVYSRDGSRIYFLRAREFGNYSPIALPDWHKIDIFSMNADGSDIRQVTAKHLFRAGGLSVDPKGKSLMITAIGWLREEIGRSSIIICSAGAPDNFTIVTPDLDGYRKRVLFWKVKPDLSEISNPQFSPDGRHMVFTWPFFDGLFLMDLEKGDVKKIWEWDSRDRQLGHMYPRFSRDGSQIVFSTMTSRDGALPWEMIDEPRLWIINVDGTGLHEVDVREPLLR